MKKIVALAPFAFFPKGTVRARMLPIMQQMAPFDYQATILIPPYDNYSQSGVVDRKGKVLLKNIHIKKGLFGKLLMPLQLFFAAWQEKPDVLYLFKPKGFSGIAWQLASMLRWLFFPRTELWLDIDDWEGCGGVNKENPYPLVWKWIFHYQQEHLIHKASVVTVASRALESLLWSRGVKPESVYYLPNAPLVIPEESIPQANAKNYLLYVGYFTFGMALDEVMNALSLLPDSQNDLELWVVGEGVNQLELENLAEELDIAPRVKFLGYVKEHDRVQHLISEAKACLVPYRDNLVNRCRCAAKLAEYMTLQKIVLASAVGQNCEYLTHGIDGFLIEPGNISDWVQTLKKLDSIDSEEIGSKAYHKIIHQFNWPHLVKSFCHYLDQR